MRKLIIIDYAQITKFALIAAFFLSLGIAAALTPVSATPLDSSLPPAPGRLQISAWMPTSWDGEPARASFDANMDTLSVISPFWYGLHNDGALAPLEGSRDTGLVDQARSEGILIIPTISNQYNRNRVHAILNDPALAATHRQNIVEEVTHFDYDGIDLDYENLAAEDKDLFSAWVADLANDLHARNRLLTITVQPKTFEADGWNGPGAQDYRALAAASDELRLMTYGWCWRSGCIGSDPPGPIAPVHWMQRVINYAKTQAPAQKLVLGVHLYGYDWHDDSKPLIQPLSLADMTGEALVWEQAEALRQEHNAILQWWERDDRGLVQEPWFSYADDTHYVTFANADSVAARAQLAEDNDLRGIILWRLGGEDPALWQRLPKRVYRSWLPRLRGQGGT